MTPERWQQVKEVFQAALERAPDERSVFLANACGGDELLRKEVESLLASHEKGGSFIDSPAYEAAAEFLADEKAELKPGQVIGSYEIISFISRGGMGEVYLAQDPRLGRKVALKLLPASFTKDVDRLRRFEREARAASALNHPNIITIYEIQQAGSSRVIATEFVEGETVRQRLSYSSLTLTESLNVAIQIADALSAAHKAGIIHRDIKPENIMIRPDGYVKVLDFGLAKLTEQSSPVAAAEAPTRQVKTGSGMIMGTVGYMSPEQARGQTVDARSDIFNLGAVIYEMVAGQKPFEGETPSDVMAAILKSEPPLLSHCTPEAPPELVRIVTKALRKDREERYQVVKDLLIDLRTLSDELQFQLRLERSMPSGATPAGAARPVTRLVVLPFRMLRADPDVDFLAFSVPDAVAGALSVLDSVVVRSPSGASGYTGEFVDLKQIAEETQAQTVLMGTILRAGDGIRVNCQLLELPNGTVLWSHQPHVSMSDLFELQDGLVRGIVESLSLSLSGHEHRRLKRDVPASPMAYEFYLRGNELSRRGLAGFGDLTVARDLYLSCLEADPHYAPAWAQLGRCYRLIGKGVENGRENLALAESAFQRALELNPDLPLAHAQYAFLEAELGRAKDAMVRLLRCAQSGSASPDLFVALVLCCRFCGLLEASVAAHERARKLDPQIATSVSHTHYQLGDYDSALRDAAVGAWGIVSVTLATMGRNIEGLAAFRKLEQQSGLPVPLRAFTVAWRAMLEGNRQESLDAAERSIQHYLDPEGVFYIGLLMAHLGESERALNVLRECMEQGFFPVRALRRNPWFDGLRSTAQFKELLKRGEARFVEADEGYRSAGGPQVLGAGLGAELERSASPNRSGEAATGLTSKPTEHQPSIAVLPFANMSADKENEYFGDGLAEEIINALAQVPGMKVAGRTSSFFFRGKDVEFGEIGRRLNVEHILEGSVRTAGNRIRVTAQLIKVADGFHLWSERYDREMTDIFAIQDEITQAIAAALQIRLSPEAATLRRVTPNLRAYAAYLEARDHWVRPTPESLVRVKECLEQAIDLDPKFALAYSLLGGHYTMLANIGFRPAREVIPLARAAEQAALRIEPSLPEAHALLGVCAGTDFEWNEAEREWRLAMAHEPVSRDVRFWYGNHYLLSIGRIVEAVEAMARGLQEDPLNVLYRHHFAVGLRHAGRLEDAEAELRRILEIDENFPLAVNTLGAIYAQQGRFEEALALTERAYALTPWRHPVIGQLAALLVRAGATSRADALLEKLGTGKEYGASTGLAVFHALCGEFNLAADWTEQAIDERYPRLVPILGPLLRSSPRWPALAKLMNLPESIQ